MAPLPPSRQPGDRAQAWLAAFLFLGWLVLLGLAYRGPTARWIILAVYTLIAVALVFATDPKEGRR